MQIRTRRSLYLSLILPLIILFAVNAGKRATQLGTPELRVAMSITFGGATIGPIGYSLATARDRDAGVFQRLRVTPAPTWAIICSRIAVQLTAILVMTAVVLGAAAAFQGVTLSPAGYLLSFAVATIGGAVFLSIGQAIVGLIRSAETLNATGRLLYAPVLLLSIFGHSDLLGTPVEYISRYSPGGSFATLLSGAMSPSTWSGETWAALPICLAYIGLFAGVGIRWFRWTSH